MSTTTEPGVPEFIQMFRLLPNEYKGLSFETAYQNVKFYYPWERNKPPREEGVNWYRQNATHSRRLSGAVPGSTLLTRVHLLNLGDRLCTLFAVGKIARAVTAVPIGATVRVRVRTVFETALAESSMYCEVSDRRYDEISGFLIEEILAIEDPEDE